MRRCAGVSRWAVSSSCSDQDTRPPSCVNEQFHATLGMNENMSCVVVLFFFNRIEISGTGLRCAYVVCVVWRSASTELGADAVKRAESSYQLAVELGAKRAVYGRTTGVGANRHTVVDPESADHPGLRLLRSHAGGTGEPLPDDAVRAMKAIRLNQLAAGGSGVHPRLLV